MSKILEKSLKDARKEKRLILGVKQVQSSVKDSKLIVMSRSAYNNETTDQIKATAKENNVPLVNFEGTSVTLGKICGLQFRASTVSFTSIEDTSINAIVNETKPQGEQT